MITNVCGICGMTNCCQQNHYGLGRTNYDFNQEEYLKKYFPNTDLKKAILCAEIKGLWKALGEKLDEWEKLSS